MPITITPKGTRRSERVLNLKKTKQKLQLSESQKLRLQKSISALKSRNATPNTQIYSKEHTAKLLEFKKFAEENHYFTLPNNLEAINEVYEWSKKVDIKDHFIFTSIDDIVFNELSVKHLNVITTWLNRIEPENRFPFLRNISYQIRPRAITLERLRTRCAITNYVIDIARMNGFSEMNIVDNLGDIFRYYTERGAYPPELLGSFLETASHQRIKSYNSRLLTDFFDDPNTHLRLDAYNEYFHLNSKFVEVKRNIVDTLKLDEKSKEFEFIRTTDFSYTHLPEFYANISKLLDAYKIPKEGKRKILGELDSIIKEAKLELNKVNARFEFLRNDYNRFKDNLSKGKEIPESQEKYFEFLIKPMYDKPMDYEQAMVRIKQALSRFTGSFRSPRNYHKLVDMSPPIEIIDNSTRYSHHKFLMQSQTLDVPTNKLLDLRNQLAISDERKVVSYLEKLKTEIAQIEKAIENKDYTLLQKNPKVQSMLSAIQKGTVSKENILNAIFKNTEIPEIVMSELVKRSFESQDASIFQKFVNGQLDAQEKTTFLNRCLELDIPLEDYLKSKGLFAIYNKVKASGAYTKVKEIRSAISEIKTKQESVTSNIEITFSDKRDLLDVFSGKFSGTCFGDHPEDMVRRELFLEKVFKDGEFVGGITNIVRRIEGKKTLVIIGIDVSESLADALSQKKKQELIDLLIARQKDFCAKNDLGIAITSRLGGISNRAGFSRYIKRKYISWKTYKIDKINIQPEQEYTTTRCNKLL